MTDRIPVKAVLSSGNAVGLAEFSVGDTTPVAHGGTGGSTAAAAKESLLIPNATAKNKLINSLLNINQRNVSGTVVLTAGQYGHDRFKAGAGGCTYTFSTSQNVTTITISAGTLQQVIWGQNLLSSTHVLSWVGTAQARIDGGAYGASGITGTAVGGTNQVCEWGVGTLSKPQYEIGSVPTEFEDRFYHTEIGYCSAYRYVIHGGAGITGAGAGYQTSTTISRISIPLPMMVSVPAVSITGTMYSGIPGLALTVSGVATGYISKNFAMIDFTTTSGGSGSATCILQTASGVGNSIVFDSEI